VVSRWTLFNFNAIAIASVSQGAAIPVEIAMHVVPFRNAAFALALFGYVAAFNDYAA
jgi:hypothetical protein